MPEFRPELFRLTKRNVHQLADIHTIVHKSYLTTEDDVRIELPPLHRLSPSSSVEWCRSRPMQRTVVQTSRSQSTVGRSSSRPSCRLTRAMSELAHFPSYTHRSGLRSSSIMSSSTSALTPPSRARHRSLVGLRAYYAFGAKSINLEDKSGSSHQQYSTSPLSLSTYGMPQSLGPHSADLASSSGRRLDSGSSGIRALTVLDRYSTSRPCSSVYSSPYSSSPATPAYRSTFSFKHDYKPISSLPSSKSAYDSSHGSVSSSRTDTEHISRPSSSSTTTALSTAAHPGSHLRSVLPQIVEHVTVQDANSSNQKSSSNRSDADWSALEDRNKALEREVEKLKRHVREKERLETELKRRLLESEAEMKVWKQKYCELNSRTPQVIHIKEPMDDPSGMAADLALQLDNAADKLAKFDVVRDMAQLQNEMEVALKEIREKPVSGGC